MDALDALVRDGRIGTQLARETLGNLDQAVAAALRKSARSRLRIKVCPRTRGRVGEADDGAAGEPGNVHEVWTFLVRDVIFTMDNGRRSVRADKVKIVSCNGTRLGDTQRLP